MAIDSAAFGAIVVSAMRSDQPLPERLAGCIRELGHLAVPGDLPPDLQERLNGIIAACTKEPDPTGDLGTATTTANKMDFWEVRQWLDTIHSFYGDVLKREEREKIAREILTVRS
jgi:hypothetical protein